MKVPHERNVGHTNIRQDPFSAAVQSLAPEMKGPGVTQPAISSSLQGTWEGDYVLRALLGMGKQLRGGAAGGP